MEYSSRGHCMRKLIKITVQYLWAYTTDRHILILEISLLQEGRRWHCHSHTAKLCLSVYQVTFDYSTLKVHISKTRNDRNKQISDSESRHLDDYIWLRGRSICTNNIDVCAKRCTETLFYLPQYYLKFSFCIACKWK